MSLVTEVFDFVKTNPGVDGMQIQNHFSNTVISDSISDLESRNAIKWISRGYYAIKQQITELKLSLDDCITELENMIREKISTECPKCHVSAKGKKQIDNTFGFRKCSGKVIPQSYCKKCRNNKIKTSYTHKSKFDRLQATVDFVPARVAKNMQNNINIEGVLVQKEIKKEFLIFSGCYKYSCTAYLVDDDNDMIKIRLWGKDVSRVVNGSRIKLLRGYTTKFNGEASVSLGFKGLLEVISFGEKIKPKKSYSFKPQTIPDQFSFENSIIDSTDNVLNIEIHNNFEQKRDDLKF